MARQFGGIWDQTAANRGGAGMGGRLTYGTGGGGAVYDSRYYNTERGMKELAEKQRAVTDQQVADLQAEMKRQQQFVGTTDHRFTPEEMGQRNEIFDAVQGAIQETQPLVQSGLVGADFVRKAMGSAVGQTIGAQRQARQADREAQAIMVMSKNSGSLRQVEGAIQKMQAKYPAEVLARSQSFLELSGAAGPLQEARQQKQGEYALELGVAKDEVTWDYDNNQPMVNKQRAADRLLVQQEKSLPIQQDIERRKIAAGHAPKRPERFRYKDDPLAGGSAQEQYDRDLQVWQQEYGDWKQQVYGDDPRMADHLQGTPQPQVTPVSNNGELADPTPVNPALIEKMVRAGLKPPGVYIGMDGNKYEITGE